MAFFYYLFLFSSVKGAYFFFLEQIPPFNIPNRGSVANIVHLHIALELEGSQGAL